MSGADCVRTEFSSTAENDDDGVRCCSPPLPHNSMAQTSQYRGWCGTLNNPTEPWGVPEAWKACCEYAVIGKEVAPGTGTVHWQIYVKLLKKATLAAVRRKLHQRAHWERQQSPSDQAAADYCKKDGEFIEYGALAPAQRRRAGNGGTDWDTIRTAVKQGDWENVPSKQVLVHYGNFKRFHEDHRDGAKDLPAGTITGIWLHGASGAGKSHYARELLARVGCDVFVKDPATKWWDNYRGQDGVLIEDVHPDHAANLSTNLKLWADRYAFAPEVKGSSAGVIRPRWIIVTSQYRVPDVFRDGRTSDAIARRFEQLELVGWRGGHALPAVLRQHVGESVHPGGAGPLGVHGGEENQDLVDGSGVHQGGMAGGDTPRTMSVLGEGEPWEGWA